MAADHPSPSAERVRRRGTRLTALFLLFMGLILGVGAWQLALSQSQDRKDLRTLYGSRATVAAGVLDSIFRVAFQQSGALAAAQFGGAIDPARLEASAKRSQVLYEAVLSADGTVLAGTKGTPAEPGKDVIATAAKSKDGLAVGDLTTVNGVAAVENAVRYPGADGKLRVIVSASPAKLFRAFLSGSLAPLTPVEGGDAYILDGNGAVLGAVSAENPRRPPPPDPALVKGIGHGATGFYPQQGKERYFASAAQPNTRWHVVVTAPTSALYKPASGVSRTLPWVILGVLGLALLAIGVLMRRSLSASARIAQVNAQLEASQDRLRERAIELQASNAELQRSNAELEQFAYVASHDLSAPLRAVAGFSQLLGVRYKGKLDGDADQFIMHMQEGVDRMQRIIDDLLTYSRVDRSGLQAEPVDLDAVLGEVLHGLGPEIAERGARVTHDHLGQGFGQAGQLSQALQNMVANGMKFTAPGVTPEVHISARRAGDRIEISVRDNGIGVDDDHAEQIFKMFQRLHSSEDYPGTGIGLAIVKKIVDRHGGQIDVEPAPGGGTVFTIDIPAEMPS